MDAPPGHSDEDSRSASFDEDQPITSGSVCTTNKHNQEHVVKEANEQILTTGDYVHIISGMFTGYYATLLQYLTKAMAMNWKFIISKNAWENGF